MGNSTIFLQVGADKVASQKGMSVYGPGRQEYVLLPQNLSFATEAKEQEPVSRKSVTVIIGQDTRMNIHSEHRDDYPRDHQCGDQGTGD